MSQQNGEYKSNHLHNQVGASAIAKAFNLGCDARLWGWSRDRNPYNCAHPKEWIAWESGWLHVHSHWGCEAEWPYQQLPLVAA